LFKLAKIIFMSVLNYPLSNVQIELMKLFNTNLSEQELAELKNVIAGFYAEKAIANADAIWKARNLSNEDMDNWLNEK
jgi:hypothetical protein